jgi:hypothetical protein
VTNVKRRPLGTGPAPVVEAVEPSPARRLVAERAAALAVPLLPVDAAAPAERRPLGPGREPDAS